MTATVAPRGKNDCSQVAENKAVRRVNGVVLSVGSFSLIPRPLQSLLPVLVELIAVPLNVIGGLDTEFNRGWLKNIQDLFPNEILQ
jgi:hypothetical protein